MEFLLNPNVAYLVLLAGVLMGFLALTTPGTGFFEIGALFCIMFAGYAVYNLSFNVWALLMLGASVVPFVYALQKPKREAFVALSILMLTLGSVFIFPSDGGGMAVNPLVAALASTLVAGFIWISVRKYMDVAMTRPAHDLDGLIGKVGEARTPVHAAGSVYVEGELWSARSETPITAGSSIRVVRRDGFVIEVEKQNS